jgi:hypothetical protein
MTQVEPLQPRLDTKFQDQIERILDASSPIIEYESKTPKEMKIKLPVPKTERNLTPD